MKIFNSVIIILASIMAGCVVIPTAIPGSDPFNNEVLKTIEPATSTRDDVRQILTNWPYETDGKIRTLKLTPFSIENGRWWYVSLGRETLGLAGCIIHYVGYSCGEIPSGYKRHYLFLEFDSSDRLVGWWLAHANTRCALSNVCFRNEYIIIPASLESNNNAKLFEPTPEHCNVYVYLREKFNKPVVMYLDKQSKWLLDKETFSFWAVDQGEHVLRFHNLNNGNYSNTTFECSNNNNHFFEYAESKNNQLILPISEKKRHTDNQ